jgi:excisionase family DNA binding protein
VPTTAPTVSLQEAAATLGVHYMTAYRYVRLGLLEAEKVGTTWQVSVEAVEQLQHRERPTGARSGRRVAWDQRFESRLRAGDAVGAWGVVEAALGAGSSPTDVHLRVIAPAMTGVGDAWERGDIDVAHEHRASVICQRVIGRMSPRFVRPGVGRGTVVLGCAPGERHAIPLLLVADVLRVHGWDVVDLGADVPTESFVVAASAAPRLAAVGVSASTAGNEQAVTATFDALRAAVPDAELLAGGRAIDGADHARSLGATAWAADGLGAAELLEPARR